MNKGIVAIGRTPVFLNGIERNLAQFLSQYELQQLAVFDPPSNEIILGGNESTVDKHYIQVSINKNHRILYPQELFEHDFYTVVGKIGSGKSAYFEHLASHSTKPMIFIFQCQTLVQQIDESLNDNDEDFLIKLLNLKTNFEKSLGRILIKNKRISLVLDSFTDLTISAQKKINLFIKRFKKTYVKTIFVLCRKESFINCLEVLNHPLNIINVSGFEEYEQELYFAKRMPDLCSSIPEFIREIKYILDAEILLKSPLFCKILADLEIQPRNDFDKLVHQLIDRYLKVQIEKSFNIYSNAHDWAIDRTSKNFYFTHGSVAHAIMFDTICDEKVLNSNVEKYGLIITKRSKKNKIYHYYFVSNTILKYFAAYHVVFNEYKDEELEQFTMRTEKDEMLLKFYNHLKLEHSKLLK